jgi:hypothetical protein
MQVAVAVVCMPKLLEQQVQEEQAVVVMEVRQQTMIQQELQTQAVVEVGEVGQEADTQVLTVALES